MEHQIEEFITYLQNTKRASQNTVASYRRDLHKLTVYLSEEHDLFSWKEVTHTHLVSYMLYMDRENFAASTISRNLAVIRSYFQYLLKYKLVEDNPAEALKAPKVEKKLPRVLTMDEINRLLKQPDLTTNKGIRDLAMLELLYATGIKVSELISLKVKDVNLKMEYITCIDRMKERIIPFDSNTQKALSSYLSEARAALIGNEKTDVLFTNYQGKPMSRQGFWKLLKQYARNAEITTEITPQTLRHSFAAHMVQNGADLRALQEMLGHSDPATTQVYVNVNLQRIRDVYDKAHIRT